MPGVVSNAIILVTRNGIVSKTNPLSRNQNNFRQCSQIFILKNIQTSFTRKFPSHLCKPTQGLGRQRNAPLKVDSLQKLGCV